MKKIIAFLLLIVTLCTLICSCSGKYEPVESTELEATTVMTMRAGADEYELKYEMYRALFLNYKNEIDGGDESVWGGDNKDEYIERINEKIIERAADIFSAFAICKQLGIDLYSKEVEDEINELIRLSVEGGNVGDVQIEGYGNYEKYLDSLKQINLNYSAQILLYRYSIAINKIDEYYIGTASTDDIDSENVTKGAIEYTENDVKNFYLSDECVRVLRMHMQAIYVNNPEARRESIVNASYGSERDVALAMINNGSFTSGPEIFNGYVIGRYNLDKSLYGEMTDAAFSLDMHEVSELITVQNGNEKIYYVLYRAEKSESHFNECYDSIAYIYLKDSVGKILNDSKQALKQNVEITDFLINLDKSQITME